MADDEQDRGERRPSAAERFRRLDEEELVRGPREELGPEEPGRRERLGMSLRQFALLLVIVAVLAFLAGILVVQIRGRVLEQVDPSPGQSLDVRPAPPTA